MIFLQDFCNVFMDKHTVAMETESGPPNIGTKRNVSNMLIVESEKDPKYRKTGGAIPKKGNTDYNEGESGGSTPRKTNPNVADTRVKAIVEEFLNNEFDTGGQISPETRELMLRFGVHVYKHFSEKEAVSSVQLLAAKMQEGFDVVQQKLDYLHEQVRDIEDSKNEVKSKEAEKTSYANMAKKLVSMKPKEEQIQPMSTELEDPTVAKKFTVLELQDKVDDEGFQIVRAKLTKKLQGQQVRVDKIVETNKGNVSLEFPTVDDQRRVENILRESKSPGTNIRSSTVKQVAVALRGIPSYLSVEDVKAHLVEGNPDHPFRFDLTEGWTLKLFQPSDKRSRYQLGKIIAPVDRARTLIDSRWKVYVALTALKVEIWKPNHTRCSKCLRSGHMAAQCSDVTTCVICGGDHAKDTCSKKDRPELRACVACVRDKKKDFKHTATTKDCPTLFEEQMMEYKKVFNYVHHG